MVVRHAFVLALFLTAGGPPAEALDLHRLWDEQCAECHGDAADFARKALTLADGHLQGRRPQRDIASFLLRHQGELPSGVTEAVYAMLLAQAGTPPLFREKCAICHHKAAELARDTLIRRDGVLIGRYTGRDIGAFLTNHGRLDGEEVTFFVDLLSRLEGEVHHPEP